MRRFGGLTDFWGVGLAACGAGGVLLTAGAARAVTLVDFGTDSGKFSKPGTGAFDYTFGGAAGSTITYGPDHVEISAGFDAPFQVLGAGFGSGDPADPFFNRVLDPDPTHILELTGRVLTPVPETAPLDYFNISVILIAPDGAGNNDYRFIPEAVSATPGELSTDGTFKAALALTTLGSPTNTGGAGFGLAADVLDQLQLFVQSGLQPDPDPPADENDAFFLQPTPQPFAIQIDQIAIVDPSAVLVGDYNGNDLVEQGDLNQVLGNWGEAFDVVSATWVSQRPAEGIVDQAELNAVLNNWGAVAVPDASLGAAPEPGALAVVGAAGLLVRRRRSCRP